MVDSHLKEFMDLEQKRLDVQLAAIKTTFRFKFKDEAEILNQKAIALKASDKYDKFKS